MEHAEEKVAEPPEQIAVFVTADFEDAPKDALDQADLRSLEGIIVRQTHLKENFAKLEYGQFYIIAHGNRYKHTLEFKIFVKTRNLWEGSRSYIWKHFGRDEWTRHDGSKVTFNRIHVK